MILVTGGTGFIGSSLCKELTRMGYSTRLLIRNPNALLNMNARDSMKASIGDLTDSESLNRAMEGVDMVFHLASVINAPRELYDPYWRNNVLGTYHLLQASRKICLKRFVYCSSVGAMGRLDAIPADERTPCHPDNFYGKSKREAEILVRSFGDKYGIPTCIIRPSWTYGPRDKRTYKLFLLIKKKRFAIIGNGKTWIHPVHVNDVVRGILQCAFHEQGAGNTYIIAGGEAVPLRNLAQLIGKYLKVKIPDVSIPIFFARAAALLMEVFFKPFHKAPPISERRLEFFVRSQMFDISKANRDIGFRPKISIQEGLKETIQWYQQEGLL